MLKKILRAIAVIVVVFLIIVACQPAEYRVERSLTMTAFPAAVFDQVNNFRRWEAWSPWAKLDPAVKNTFTGAAIGTGAIFTWSGNDKVGEGTMTLTESQPNKLIRINLQFVRPFASTSIVEFTFRPDANQTVVTWSMEGRKNFVSKAFGLFVSMNKMLGGEFEKGLAQLKTVVETVDQK